MSGFARRTVLGFTMVAMLAACGGGGSPAGPTSTPTPPPSVTTVIAQGTGSIGRFEVLKAVPFTSPASGKVDVTVDWSATTHLLQVNVFRGKCTADELVALNCSTAIAFNNPPKPIRSR
jgi:hypothetical protein